MIQHITPLRQIARPSADKDLAAAPRPARRPVERTLFGDTAELPYRWMRDARSAEVRAHLVAENAYTDSRTSSLGPLRRALSVALPDAAAALPLSVPVLLDDWWYIDRSDPLDGSTVSRVRDGAGVRGDSGVPRVVPGRPLPGEEILVADCTGVLGVVPSPDHRLLARAEAARGGCRVVVTDAATGEVLDEALHGAGPELVFTADSRFLLHTRLDDLGRPHQVRLHRLGAPASEDVILLEEPDHWAEVTLSRSRDGAAALLSSAGPTRGETWLVDLADPAAPPRTLTGPITGAVPAIEHAGDRLLVLHEDEGTGRAVLGEAPLDSTDVLADLRPLLTAEDGEHLVAVEAFAGAVALELRSGARPAVRVVPRTVGGDLVLDAVQTVGRGGPLDAVTLEPTPDWHAAGIRCRLESLTTPPTLLEHEIATAECLVLGRTDVPGHHPERYVEQRLWATAPDGARIPLSLLARRDVPRDGTAPALLHVRGGFGQSLDPELRPELLGLADRGLVIAVAHVRGGGENGPDWHRQGRRRHRETAVGDLLACADHLVAEGWAAADRLGAAGEGPGALLLGAAANRAPERFRALLAGMPLTDPLETLLDPDVMLTLEEWEEWGDPAADAGTYRSLRACTPAENVHPAPYPAVYAWTALEGAEAPPACAAIWIAQLRHHTTADSAERPILLRVHESLPGAADPRAEGTAWVLDQLGAATLGG
ncbi:prolyl oligopeptidase family serine peptidase [Brachybacterium saurashtrense]|uniref:S9 family peptidase n=1 Tax=Brachybacterium saurashtrense TaxID=556288 RepID=A0A345YSN2_9MICO|nr:prolyl oligopeptidase family serine peptidase [Brachybacterium saurashtrense]AXK46934.1 S9 family peptidase [Brachybacterium saurashtrense]RRR22649.1 S9 family peptidase [Brachybacterium saurashtrense]